MKTTGPKETKSQLVLSENVLSSGLAVCGTPRFRYDRNEKYGRDGPQFSKRLDSSLCVLATPGNSNITLPIGFFWSNSSPH